MIFSCMPNGENARNLINWYILLIEPQNYHRRRQHFTGSQNLPNEITLLTKKRQLSWCVFNKRLQLLRYSKLEKKEPHCILLHKKKLQTKEKKIFAIIEGTLFFPFFETVFTLPHAIPSNLHLSQITDKIDDNFV